VWGLGCGRAAWESKPFTLAAIGIEHAVLGVLIPGRSGVDIDLQTRLS